MRDIEKINVRIPLDGPPDADLDALLEIFGRWRLEEGEEIIDLADYGHVEEGPGCLLVSHRWHFGIDMGGGRPSLYFSVRKGLSGSLGERISQAVRGLLAKARRLLAEERFPASLRPRWGEIEVVLNDRLQAPNTDAADQRVRAELDAVASKLYGVSAKIEREADPARRLGYRLRASSADGLSLEEIERRLS